LRLGNCSIFDIEFIIANIALSTIQLAMRHLLFVEDDTFLRNIIGSNLTAAGYHVEMAINMKMAKEKYEDMVFDMIILDISLPDGNGFDWAKELAMEPTRPLILFLTSHTAAADVITGFELGGVDYLKKPIDVEELKIRIKYILKDQNTGIGQDRIIGEYQYNPTTHMLTYKGMSTHLGQLQGSVLGELSEIMGKVVSKEELLIKYWGEANYFTSRNLDSVIVKLRTQFKNDNRIHFTALKRRGYQLLLHDKPLN
jgi:DNA-binding response OmpR family regulator